MTTTKPAAKSKAARGISAAPAVRSRLNKKAKTTAFLMAEIPTILVVALVWYPAFGSVACRSPTGTESTTHGHQVHRAEELPGHRHHLPPFWPALQHNVLWLVSLFLIFTHWNAVGGARRP